MIENFDPNSVGVSSNNIFGLPTTEENAELIILPIPWEVTVSYRPGTARAPEKIFEASFQVDLCDLDAKDYWKYGYYMPNLDKQIIKKNDYLRHCAELIISNLADGETTESNAQLKKKLEEINIGGKDLHDWIYNKAKEQYQKGKVVCLLGGDHSTPLGFIKAVTEQYGEIGILQIDAHADLRNAYEGFIYSHASIMHNVLAQIPGVSKLVQVGIRDYCDEETEAIANSKGRVVTYFDQSIKDRMYEGETWKTICDEIIQHLPQQVYISFDIDGLDPKLCSNTGTPVQGGFEAEQIQYLFKKLVASGRTIVAFDLNEVSCGEHTQDAIDANVGARVLYKMCNLLMKSKYK